MPSNYLLNILAKIAAFTLEMPPVALAAKSAMWSIGYNAKAFRLPKVKPTKKRRFLPNNISDKGGTGVLRGGLYKIEQDASAGYNLS